MLLQSSVYSLLSIDVFFCLLDDVSGAFLNVMEGALPEPVGTDMPDEYQTITILADFVYVT